jgi:phospholipid/cholesterol/gamma-HCH transport system permease protein
LKPFLRFVEHIGGVTRLGCAVIQCIFRPPWELRRILDEMDELGVRSLSIVNLTAIFTGMVLAVQISYSLRQFGATTFVPDIVSLSMVRELGPVLTALVVGGRVGAGITAELGSMKVTEQVDAVRALGADPIKKLAWPKVSALFIVLPALTVLAIFVGVFLGGVLIAITELQQGVEYFFHKVIGALLISDVVSGIGKSFFFALIISIIGCYNGLNAQGGADGVGRATTNTVVAASITILISDFFLTKIFLMVL